MRLFVAVWPPDELVAQLLSLPRTEVAGLRWSTREQWHVTLVFLGEVREVAEAVAAFRSIRLPPRPVATAGPRTAVLGRRVLQLPVAGLEPVAKATRAAMKRVGAERPRKEFSGHLTLARARATVPASVAEKVATTPIVSRWEVDEVTLVASTLRRQGSLYEVIDRRALESR